MVPLVSTVVKQDKNQAWNYDILPFVLLNYLSSFSRTRIRPEDQRCLGKMVSTILEQIVRYA